MNKLKFETPDMVTDNIDKIAALFPSAITEMRGEDGEIKRGVNFEVLKQLLSRDVVDGDECYEFTWVGKKAAMAEAARPITKTLRPVKADSRDWDTTENLYIEGDNLEVLKILQESYLGKVKMIYIDPPYNTGNDGFVYPDDFSVSTDEYDDMVGLRDEENNILFRKNPDSNPRFHSDWCSMMYSRLILCRNMLNESGVIFISIDDNEAGNIRTICDEVFGADNYLETFYLQVRFASKSLNEKDDFQKLIEQVLIYAKCKTQFKPSKPFEEYDLSKFCWEVHENAEGELVDLGGKSVRIFKPGEYEIKQVLPSINALKETWASGSILKGNTSGKFFDKYLSVRPTKDGYGCLYKVEGIGEDGIGYRYFTGPKKSGFTKGKFYSGVPISRKEEIATGVSKKYKPIINFYDYSGDFGNISHEGGVTFRSGKKPIKMINHFLEISNIKSNDIILDFFSGSASTAHAVMQYNLEHQTRAIYVLVQYPEQLLEDDDLYRAGFSTICDVGKERIRRAGDKIKSEHPDAKLDTGFRVFRVDESNMEDIYYHPEELTQTMLGGMVSNIKPDRTDLDLLYACLLDWGVEISLSHTQAVIDGCTVHNVDNGALCACFDERVPLSVIDYMAKQQLLRAVFRDSSFAADDSKINVTEIFKNLSPDTKVKVI